MMHFPETFATLVYKTVTPHVKHNLSTNFNPPRVNLTDKKSYKTCMTLYHLLRTRNRIQYHLLKTLMGGIQAQEENI